MLKFSLFYENCCACFVFYYLSGAGSAKEKDCKLTTPHKVDIKTPITKSDCYVAGARPKLS